MKKLILFSFCFFIFSVSLASAQSYGCFLSSSSGCRTCQDTSSFANCQSSGTSYSNICSSGVSVCAGLSDTDCPASQIEFDNLGVQHCPISGTNPTPNPFDCTKFNYNSYSWSCCPDGSHCAGTYNCNSANPGACDPNNPSSCIGSHPNNYDKSCPIDTTGSYQWCCGPALAGQFISTPIPTPIIVPPWFCQVSGLTARGIDTGLGCVTFCAGTFAAKFMAWGGLTNLGIAFIIITIAAGMFVISGGDAKKIQAAKELLMSAVGGIILIILSLVLLNFIGVNVLQLNTLGFKNTASCNPITFTLPLPTPTRIPPTPLPTSKITPTPTPTLTPTIIPTATPIPPVPTICTTRCWREPYDDCRQLKDCSCSGCVHNSTPGCSRLGLIHCEMRVQRCETTCK